MSIPRSDVNRLAFARWLQTSRGWFIAFTERLLQGEKQPFSCRVNGQQSLLSSHCSAQLEWLQWVDMSLLLHPEAALRVGSC